MTGQPSSTRSHGHADPAHGADARRQPRGVGTGRQGRTARAAGTVAAGLVLTLAAVTLFPALLGYERYAITGGSMQGTIDRGSLVYSERAPVSELERGDVITYEPPAGSGLAGRTTHRIVWVGRDGEGRRLFRTKGDANAAADPWTFTLDRPTQARYAWHVPYVGYVISALSLRPVRILVIGLPAFLVALALIGAAWREAGDEARRRAARPACDLEG